MTVTTRRLFRSAIYLLFTLINVAALYFAMQYEFIAAVQIVVYVGGIIVLILFSLFLTQQAGVDLPVPSLGRVVFASSLAFFGFVLLFTIARLGFSGSETGELSGSLEMNTLGKQMLSFDRFGYVLPFEVVSILLLAAMIGAIAIAFRTKKDA
ncbi:MAG: NADH-quinone oxidoreductase subunit J [Bacteroidia bacterium]|nr:NADH-quinone oxidoreductase subunit J [Bacteroidia bacterium]